MNPIAEAFVRVRSDTRGFQQEAGAGILGSIKRIAVRATALLGGLAIGKALFVDPIKSAAQFEQTLNVLQATTGATDAQMKAVSARAIQLGSDVKLPGTSASDAAQAMLELAKGGLTVNQAMAAVHGTLLASAAAQIDNATAAKIVAGALGAFNLKGSQATNVANLLAGAANASTGEMTDYAQGLQQVGASAHGLGVPLKDTVGALAELAHAGIQGSDAGTSLKTMFQKLNPSTKAAKDLVDKYNLSAFDQQGNFLGLSKVADKYRAVLSKMTPQQRQAALQTIFGSDATRAANIILGQGGGTLDKYIGKVSKAGQAQKLAAAQNAGLAGAWDGLRSVIETLQLEIGLKLVPVLTQLTRWLSANLPTAVHAMMAVIGAAVPIIATLASVIGTVISFIADHIDVFAPFAAGIAIVVGAFIGLQLAMVGLTAVSYALGTALAFAFSPVVLIVVGIGLLVGAIIYAYTHFQTFHDIVDTALNAVWSTVQFVFNAIKAVISTAIQFVLALWNRFGSTIVAMARTYFNGIMQIIRGVMQVIRGIINVVLGLIHGDFGRVWKGIQQIVNGALNIIVGYLRASVGVMLTAAKAIGTAILNGITGFIKSLPGKLSTIVGAIHNALSSAANAAWNYAVGLGSRIINGIVDGLSGLAGAITGKIESGIKSGIDAVNPFSPIEVGAAKYLGQPIVAGTIAGLAGLAPALTGSLNAGIRAGVTGVSGSRSGTTASGAAAVASANGDAYTFNGPVTFQTDAALPGSQDDLRSVVRKLRR